MQAVKPTRSVRPITLLGSGRILDSDDMYVKPDSITKGVDAKILLTAWLYPPDKKIQITDFARGTTGLTPARTTPSLINVDPSASPVNPSPMSARNRRRETWPQGNGVLVFML